MARSLPLPTAGSVFISPAKHGTSEVRVECVFASAFRLEFRTSWRQDGELHTATPSMHTGAWAGYSKAAKLRPAA